VNRPEGKRIVASLVPAALVGLVSLQAGGSAHAAPAAPAAPGAPATSRSPALPPAAPARRPTGPRVAILEMGLEGEGAAPALAMQLQDGFVIGLVRSGIDVVDSADVDKKLAGSPELKGCESSPCLKRAGELLGARFALRVRVALTGNSYKMAARLFSTEGAAPAALPVATLTRSCDVCTVGEAREAMIKLADSMRGRLEAETASLAPPPPPPPEGNPHLGPLAVLGGGVLAVALGAAIIASAGDSDKGRAALGGTFLGAGITTSAVGLVMTLAAPAPTPNAAKTAMLYGRFAF
jgi:hypothetical protein